MKQKAKINKFWFYFLSFTWGLLWTIIGALIYLGIKLFYGKHLTFKSKLQGVVRTEGYRNLPGAISLGLFIIFDETMLVDDDIVAHEFGHCIQALYFGPLFIFIVAIPSIIRAALWLKIQRRHYRKYRTYKNYYGIWFESQATKIGLKYI